MVKFYRYFKNFMEQLQFELDRNIGIDFFPVHVLLKIRWFYLKIHTVRSYLGSFSLLWSILRLESERKSTRSSDSQCFYMIKLF